MTDVAQYKELMRRSSEISMQQIRNVTGLQDTQLNAIYNRRLNNIVEYFRQQRSPKPMLDSIKPDNFKGMVVELNCLEYDTFIETKAGKAALKEGIIEESWIEHLLGEGGVSIYNQVARACGFREISLARQQFEKLKKNFNNEVSKLDKQKNLEAEIDAFLQNTPILRFDPIKDIAGNYKLSKQARRALMREYLNRLAHSQSLNIANFTMDQAITALQRRNPEQHEQMQKLRLACGRGDIDLREPMKPKLSGMQIIAGQSGRGV
jgi:hypothetical protein